MKQRWQLYYYRLGSCGMLFNRERNSSPTPAEFDIVFPHSSNKYRRSGRAASGQPAMRFATSPRL